MKVGIIGCGRIGTPVAAVASMMGHGPEDWHPNPDFFYKTGGGPLMGMGPHYITALIALLGPVKSVVGTAKISADERVIANTCERPEALPLGLLYRRLDL